MHDLVCRLHRRQRFHDGLPPRQSYTRVLSCEPREQLFEGHFVAFAVEYLVEYWLSIASVAASSSVAVSGAIVCCRVSLLPPLPLSRARFLPSLPGARAVGPALLVVPLAGCVGSASEWLCLIFPNAAWLALLPPPPVGALPPHAAPRALPPAAVAAAVVVALRRREQQNLNGSRAAARFHFQRAPECRERAPQAPGPSRARRVQLQGAPGWC